MMNSGLEFSWSFSAAQEFEACPRRRYWAKYAAPFGRRAEASDLDRRACRLNQLSSFSACMGIGIDRAITEWMHAGRRGDALEYEQGYRMVADYLNRLWRESKSGAWHDAPPGQTACLFEHYYRRWNRDEEQAQLAAGKERVETCLRNFLEHVWPGLKDLSVEAEVPVASATKNRSARENFMYQGLRIYAIPDYVYRKQGVVVIVDWKSGRPWAEEHARQLGVYGLWATHRPDLAALSVTGVLEYLYYGRKVVTPLPDKVIEGIESWIQESVTGMASYLENGDWRRNRPVPYKEWDLAAEPQVCASCRFYELCQPELEI